jgi:hypothetical protein
MVITFRMDQNDIKKYLKKKLAPVFLSYSPKSTHKLYYVSYPCCLLQNAFHVTSLMDLGFELSTVRSPLLWRS